MLINPTAGSDQSLHYSKKSKRTENTCAHTYTREPGHPKEGQIKSSLCSFNVRTEMKDGLFAHPHRTQPRPQQVVALLALPRWGCGFVSWELTYTERGEQEIYISKFRAFDSSADFPSHKPSSRSRRAPADLVLSLKGFSKARFALPRWAFGDRLLISYFRAWAFKTRRKEKHGEFITKIERVREGRRCWSVAALARW